MTNYYRSPKIKKLITSINSQVPLVLNTNLATGTINKTVVIAITIQINTVVDQ